MKLHAKGYFVRNLLSGHTQTNTLTDTLSRPNDRLLYAATRVVGTKTKTGIQTDKY